MDVHGSCQGRFEPVRRVGFGYVMNQMGVSLGTDERVHNLTRALYTALGEG